MAESVAAEKPAAVVAPVAVENRLKRWRLKNRRWKNRRWKSGRQEKPVGDKPALGSRGLAKLRARAMNTAARAERRKTSRVLAHRGQTG